MMSSLNNLFFHQQHNADKRRRLQQQQQQVPPQSERSLIVHGADALPGRYPYFVTLDRFCAGALIAPDMVLTAGHCRPEHKHDVGQLHIGTYFMDYDRDAASVEQSLQGDNNGSDGTAATALYEDEVFEIAHMKRHPLWQRRGDDEFTHDFTILHLNGLSKRPFLRLNRESTVPGPQETVVAMGLGDLTEEADVRPTVLQEVALQYLPSEECRTASDEDESYSNPPDRIGPTHLCTFVAPDNDRDACNYDSGGPIIIPGSSGTGDDDLLVALVSWGIGCADPIFPGVNARVSAVSDWIDEHVCKWSAAPPKDFKCGGNDEDNNNNNTLPPPTPEKTHSHHHNNLLAWGGVSLLLVAALLFFVSKRRRSEGWERYDGTKFPDFPGDMKRHNTSETTQLRSYSSIDSDNDSITTEGKGDESPHSYQNTKTIIV